ncbi:hypothetical protein Syun_025904 [Stephania yunnanensis]|uniref:Uncharacterized protein n=1 Tax=Stephania yunnanensis TaxID=152371 RepID=A0AAP0F1E1_9MAGN
MFAFSLKASTPNCGHHSCVARLNVLKIDQLEKIIQITGSQEIESWRNERSSYAWEMK